MVSGEQDKTILNLLKLYQNALCLEISSQQFRGTHLSLAELFIFAYAVTKSCETYRKFWIIPVLLPTRAS